ncbi:MAG: hypothetical protein AMK73_00715 [Planctomycetes bacterium SM23_32]|nr:MAG: hypothetical protein AMK73_00715 [Planctomycetes bacterium SM23_32]
MAIDIWWYGVREQWCADVPAGNGRRRLYLGPNESKARAELHRYMAAYYDGLEEDRAKAKKAWARHDARLVAVGAQAQGEEPQRLVPFLTPERRHVVQAADHLRQ